MQSLVLVPPFASELLVPATNYLLDNTICVQLVACSGLLVNNCMFDFRHALPLLVLGREEVTVRCACKRLKAKWSCQQVQAALLAAGKDSWYDAGVAPRLLSCNAGCEQKSAAAAGAGADAGLAVQEEEADSRQGQQHAPVQQPQVPQQPRQRLSKAEREAQARLEAERKKAERRLQTWRRAALSAAIWLVIALIGLAIGIWGKQLLAWVDATAQARWRPS